MRPQSPRTTEPGKKNPSLPVLHHKAYAHSAMVCHTIGPMDNAAQIVQQRRQFVLAANGHAQAERRPRLDRNAERKRTRRKGESEGKKNKNDKDGEVRMGLPDGSPSATATGADRTVQYYASDGAPVGRTHILELACAVL